MFHKNIHTYFLCRRKLPLIKQVLMRSMYFLSHLLLPWLFFPFRESENNLTHLSVDCICSKRCHLDKEKFKGKSYVYNLSTYCNLKQVWAWLLWLSSHPHSFLVTLCQWFKSKSSFLIHYRDTFCKGYFAS